MKENVGKHTNLFIEEEFVGHSGGTLHWKIEMDALTNAEWKCIARMIMEYQKGFFQAAIGIPRGGLKLSQYLNEYATQNSNDPYLLVDDVLTTGGSMEQYRDEHLKEKDVIGWVVFARTIPAGWIKSLFQMPKEWVDNPNNAEYYK